VAAGKKRRYGKHDGVPARRYTLAPIAAGEPLVAPLLVEPAWDGHRVLATRDGERVRLLAADHRDWTATFPAIVRALEKLSSTHLALDGVICVLDARGTPSFEDLKKRVAAGTVTTAVLMCWDLLAHGDEDLRAVPLRERRARLVELLAGAASVVMVSTALDGELDRVQRAASALGIRGVVARALDGAYAAAWRAHGELGWPRSLSPPPPLSNADKVLYPRDAICKRDIVAYYRDIAPALLPHLADRAVVVQRWPDGIDEFDWYQHRMPPRAPDYLRAQFVDGVRRIVVENVDALLWMANQAGLTFHSFASRITSLPEPDYAMIDLDPGDRSTWWTDLVDVALGVRRALELLELPSVVKTSGQRGLHVLVPLAPGHTFAQAEELARGIATMLVALLPDKVSVEQEKDKRAGRLLVDHKQFLAKTLVAPYSLRGADRAPVSTPIAWDEVTHALDPRAFTLRSVRARVDAKGDLAQPLLAGTARLDRALAQLRDRKRSY
jgi:DNA ligase D-like protein (predicted polymerase)